MQRYRLLGVTTPEQPHGRRYNSPSDHITLLLGQVGTHGTALLVELPEPYVSTDAPLYDAPVVERVRRSDQIGRAVALWRIMRPLKWRKTYVDVYPVSDSVVDLDIWSTSYEGACSLGDASFHVRLERVQLAAPCLLTPTHSLEAVPFVETRRNPIKYDTAPVPLINVWHTAAD